MDGNLGWSMSDCPRKEGGREFAPACIGTESKTYLSEGLVKNIGVSETDGPGSQSRIHHLLAVWLRYVASLSFGSLLHKKRMTKLTP